MASLYADESFPLPVVEALRNLGHDVLTLDRWDFIGLHARLPRHAGIVVCTADPDVDRQATAIDAGIRNATSLPGALLRVNRPA